MPETAWKILPTFSKTSGRPMVSASLKQGKDGTVKLSLFLSVFIADALGNPDTVTLQVGEGEAYTDMRITANGEHKLGKGPAGSRRITAPSYDGLPSCTTGNLPCRLITDKAGEVIIQLPVAEWWRTAATRPAPVITPKASPSPAGGKVDVIAFLETKGIKVQRLAEGRFLYDGNRVGMPEILGVVNAWRRKANLADLTADTAI